MVKQFRTGQRQSLRTAISKSKNEQEKANAARTLVNMKKENNAGNALANMKLNREIDNLNRDIVKLEKDIKNKQKELNKIVRNIYLAKLLKKK
tara:strand:- start:102 stop:380 length:279 start_codon:yes stop_codon:yes gene_type:complete